MIDDLQWADVASLQLFGHLAARLPRGTAIIGALRDRAPTPGTELRGCSPPRAGCPATAASGSARSTWPTWPNSSAARPASVPGSDAARSIHARTAATRSSSGSCPGSSSTAAARPRTQRHGPGCRPPCATSSATGWPTSTTAPRPAADRRAHRPRRRARPARPRRRPRRPDLPRPARAAAGARPARADARGSVLVPLRARPGPRVGRRRSHRRAGRPGCTCASRTRSMRPARMTSPSTSGSPTTCGRPARWPIRPAPRTRWSAPAAARRPSPRSRPPSGSCDRPRRSRGRRAWPSSSCPPCRSSSRSSGCDRCTARRRSICWSAPSSWPVTSAGSSRPAGFLYSRWVAHAQGIELRPQRPAGAPVARAGQGIRRSDRARVRPAGLGHSPVGHRQHR